MSPTQDKQKPAKIFCSVFFGGRAIILLAPCFYLSLHIISKQILEVITLKKLSDAERKELRKKMAEQRQRSSENLARRLGESEAQDSNLLALAVLGGGA